MRRKPSNGSYNNNQHRRPQRYQQGGGSGDQRSQGGSYQHGRPRRNYGAAREKYLNQAREALAAGDRVAAENWFQHADHCYRMMVEEGQHRQNYTPPPQQPGEAEVATAQPETFVEENTNALPAFLHVNPEQPAQAAPIDPATIQNWEERDEA